MLDALLQVLTHAFIITSFVFVMMLVIEYVNVLTSGKWDRLIEGWTWGQSLLTGLLGAAPGCLGPYAVTSLYMHRVISVGAVTAAMIATSGDEAFVMLALFPGKALLIFGVLLVIGVVTGVLTDTVLRYRRTGSDRHLAAYQPSHANDAACIPFSHSELVRQWTHCSRHRAGLTTILALFVLAVATGHVGHRHLAGAGSGNGPSKAPQAAETGRHVPDHASHAHAAEGATQHAADSGHGHAEHSHAHKDHGHVHEGHGNAHEAREHAARPADSHLHGTGHAAHGGEWDWVRITLLVLGLIGLAIVVTVPDHFLEEHLWRHLVCIHLWRIFVWTLAALLVTHLLVDSLDVGGLIREHRLPILLLACLVGIIPASGPHLVFVTLFAEGALPLSTFLASCIVQDGHGSIPLLAHSRRAFAGVKALNVAIGLFVGMLGWLLGF